MKDQPNQAPTANAPERAWLISYVGQRKNRLSLPFYRVIASPQIKSDFKVRRSDGVSYFADPKKSPRV